MTYTDSVGNDIVHVSVGASHVIADKKLTINVFDFGKGTNLDLTTTLDTFFVTYTETYKMNHKLLAADQAIVEGKNEL